jgi:hypothetical protein
LSAGIYAVTDLFYVIFGTGVEQPWNKLASEPETSSTGDGNFKISTITAAYGDIEKTSSSVVVVEN